MPALLMGLESSFRSFVSCSGQHCSIDYLKRRAVLRPGLAVIVNPCRRDVRMPQPFLDFGNIRLVVERVGGGRRAPLARPDLEPQRR
jgi:hypothetical protein